MQDYNIIPVARDPIIRAGIHALLNSTPDIMVVGEAEDQHTLTLRLSEQSCDVLLICLDHVLETMAIHLINTSKRIQPLAKVLVLAHNQSPEVVRRYVIDGVNGYLPYGLDRAALTKAIRDVREYGLVLSQHVVDVLNESAPAQHHIDRMTALTIRKQEVLREVAAGRTNLQIAQHLNISVDTVRTHLKHIYEKLDLDSRAALVTFAVRAGVASSEHNQT